MLRLRSGTHVSTTAGRNACLAVPAHSVASSSRVFQVQAVQRRKYVVEYQLSYE